MVKIGVLGAGSWGTVLANLLVQNGHSVTLWDRNQDRVDEINHNHTNAHYLPDFELESALEATSSLETAVKDQQIILFVVPTMAMREVSHQVNAILETGSTRPAIAHATKGLEQHTHKRISQILEEEISANHRNGIVVLSGPSHAEEVARHDITAITAASKSKSQAEWLQSVFMNNYFRLYTSQDVIGVEMGAALKNVIAVGAGILNGLHYGDDAKAALLTRGLAEITRLGVAMGANALTFIGLSGVGDLVVTCNSVHSRNWRAGNQLGQGKPLGEVLEQMGMVVEGVATSKSAFELSQDLDVDMPITTAIYNVLYEDKDVKTEIDALMRRTGKAEIDF